ncbi:sensor histidine kinase [Streptomyces caatingaensis]|uniref:sensor histidine kinase n=1 Tax=Streptomyces caatingaensis TaxID=1678637 RepID=UPI001F528953|nr:histidine kinase [Streptomyces caatingaensis]
MGEIALAAGLALLTGAGEYLTGQGPVRAVLAGLAVAVLSSARRTLPATVLVAAGALDSATNGGLLLVVAAWSAGRRIKGVLRALTAFTASFVACEAFVLVENRSPVWIAFSVLLFLVMAVVPGITGRYWSQRRALLQTLRERNAQLLRERQMIARQARMRERQRIAQDMHDSLGHQLALIAVQTGALEVSRGLSEQQREAVGVLREASVAAMHELRAVVGVLKDGTVEEARAESGVVAGIDGLVESAAAAGTDVRLVRSGDPRPLGAPADHAAYRVVQEGLTNAFKHAPGARIGVGLYYEADSLVVEVVNGPPPGSTGAAAVSGGQGLTGLRERARLAGGMVHAGPAADGGFRLAGVFPYGAGPGTAPAEAGDDLRQQPPAPGPDEGGRAAGDGQVIDPLDPREEFRHIVSVRRSRGCLVGCGVGLLCLVVLAVVVALGIGKIFDEMRKASMDPGLYRSITVGTSEAEVRGRLPSGDSFLTSGVRGKGPAEPAGSQCLSLLSTDSPDDIDRDRVYRFCFKGGKLIEKREFVVKND